MTDRATWAVATLGASAALAVGVGVYAYRNLTYDQRDARLIARAGMREKQVTLPDGSVLSYGESSGPGTIPLLLLHGQQTSWETYARSLPRLVETYHVFAVDYYGHGGSSKNPEKYSARAIGTDLAWFIENVIGAPAVVSGHSSGGLLTAWLAGNVPEQVLGVVIEDAPFFSTEPGRAEKTFAWLEFRDMHEFLSQDEEISYLRYLLEHTSMQDLFNSDGRDSWSQIIKNPALRRLEKRPGEIPRLWYYPPSLGVNTIFDLAATIQDGTGNYDLRFGETFFDYSWFGGFDQAETLARISCPTTILHVAPGKATAPSYYDSRGILLSAMDAEDAQRAADLVEGAVLIDGIESGHNIHGERPQDFAQILTCFAVLVQ